MSAWTDNIREFPTKTFELTEFESARLAFLCAQEVAVIACKISAGEAELEKLREYKEFMISLRDKFPFDGFSEKSKE